MSDENVNEEVDTETETTIEVQPTRIVLGEKTFHELDIEKDEWGIVREVNRVYVNTSNENKTDKLQFTFDPSKKWFHFGKVKQKQDSSTDSGEENYYNIYLKPYIISGDGSVIEEGSSGGQLDTTIPDSGSTGNNYLTALGKGFGILIDNTVPQAPIVSVDSSIIPSETKINTLIDEKLSNLDINGECSGLDFNNPDIMALMELLEVMKVQYEDEPIEVYDSASNYVNYTDRNIKGFRFVWTGNEKTFNCLRLKQQNDNNEEIYLKIIDGGALSNDTLENNVLPFGAIGDKIDTVSSNKVHQLPNEWNEWYFPKNIVLKRQHIYIVIPHHDKSYRNGVTTSTSILKMQTTNDYNSAFSTEVGVWTSDRTSTVTTCTPIFQLCYKNPTTITMIR